MMSTLTAQAYSLPGARTGQDLRRRLASLGLVAVLVGVPGFAFWGAVSSYRSGEMARHATALSDALEMARYSVGEEESLERKYRLEPSQDVRERHSAASAAVLDALVTGRPLADSRTNAVIDAVLARHATYRAAISRMFAAIDQGDVARTNAIDAGEVDPVFGDIVAEVSDAAKTARLGSEMSLGNLATVQTRLLVGTPLVFLLGLALVVFFWRVLASSKREVENAVAREADASRRGERRFRSLVQNASDLLLICSPDGSITFQSPATQTAWGYEEGHLAGRALSALVHPDDAAAVRDLFDQTTAKKGATKVMELRLSDLAENWRYAELVLTNLLAEPAVGGLVATVHDLQERKAFEQQLTQQAFYDGLTRLPNRALFGDRIEQALVRSGRRNKTIALLFLDIDNFKLINDSLGHKVGDQLLVEVSRRLQTAVREADTVARIGGDEFVILLENVADEIAVSPRVDSVRTQFSRPFVLEGRDITVTASIGIALSTTCDLKADSLLRNADLAMYRAKAEGKGRHVVFDPSMHVDMLAQLEMERDLQSAIEGGQLRVFYQPIVPLGSQRVTEVEALVRWQHPTRGMVSPVDFIPLAEKTGIIIPLGLWVLKEACRQGAAWQRRFPSEPPLIVSVNLSPRQFQMDDLAEEVERTLREAGLPAPCLKLEITEGTLMVDVESTIATLTRLKSIGIKLAIDDFGTGYSSLAYLKRLPLDVLKIDRSFIAGIVNNSEDKAIVQAILLLARSLNLEVTAEGIETAEQAAILSSWACDRGQGFYFARPTAAEEMGALLDLEKTDSKTKAA